MAYGQSLVSSLYRLARLADDVSTLARRAGVHGAFYLSNEEGA